MMMRANSELPVGSSLLRVGLMGLTGVLAILAVVYPLLASRYQQHLLEASRYNGAFDFGQGAVELLRLQVALEESRRDPESAGLRLRYDILKNRIGILEASGLTDKERPLLFGRLRATLDHIGPLLPDVSTEQAVDPLIDQLRPFVGQFLRTASRAHAESGDLVTQNQQDLDRVLGVICTITLTLVLVGAALIVVVLRQNKRLDGIARTDALTGLANRFAFTTALQSCEAPRRAIALVDVDHFKSINDTLGHEAGDRLLCLVAERLRAAAPETATLARVGGDEFAVLFCGDDAARESETFVERALVTIQQPAMVGDREITPSITQGLCIAQDGDWSSLFNDADIALYAAKVAGRGRHMTFEPAMKMAFQHRQRLLEAMRGAVSRHEFFLVYQPIVDLTDDRPRGFEALMRWRHPDLGLVSPAEFIPLAEESGLIQPMGRWVIDEACQQAAAWPRSMFVAVNVSARQLTDVTLVDHIARCLAEYRIDGSRLEIEVTESILIENGSTTLDVLNRIRALGCRISLDDFGTGYASLSYLCRFRFDKLKIDQSFVRGNPCDGESMAIVAMICGLANRLDLTIVAEGIETREQRDVIRKAGSHLGQGYLFHRPLAPPAVAALLAEMAYAESPQRAAA